MRPTGLELADAQIEVQSRAAVLVERIVSLRTHATLSEPLGVSKSNGIPDRGWPSASNNIERQPFGDHAGCANVRDDTNSRRPVRVPTANPRRSRRRQWT